MVFSAGLPEVFKDICNKQHIAMQICHVVVPDILTYRIIINLKTMLVILFDDGFIILGFVYRVCSIIILSDARMFKL